jgi:acetyl-CoA carboxylase biotin carboxyl carrier protein
MRMHERTVAATARSIGDTEVELASPAPGLFRITVGIGDVVRPGTVLGELEVLGQLVAIVAPPTARGAVVAVCDRASSRPPVEFGAMLVRVDPSATTAGIATNGQLGVSVAAAEGLVFRAPTSGRFYGRPTPDKAAFVTVGAELAAGTTICLLEVMKAFHRVTYGGDGLPERARVRAVLVTDGADVNAGDALLALDPL